MSLESDQGVLYPLMLPALGSKKAVMLRRSESMRCDDLLVAKTFKVHRSKGYFYTGYRLDCADNKGAWRFCLLYACGMDIFAGSS